ncbi:MAG: carbohydrate ABC transporter permease [Ignavibacteria bacterium]|nr:carbohydrate ABC transporter permease [Ignavibacteria bacterium]
MKVFKKIFLSSILFLFIAIALFPFVWLISTSLKGAEEIFQFPPKLIPSDLTFKNFVEVWEAIPFGKYYLNSFIVSIAVVFGNLFLGSLTGFLLARRNFKFKNILFFFVLVSILIPQEMILIPLYLIVLKLKLIDSLAGIILPAFVNGFSIFMMRQAFLSIPKEIEDAALSDGCNLFKLYWKVMLPMTKPTLISLGLLIFISTWGDFLFPLIVLRSQENYTLQVGLSYMTGTFVDNFRLIAAGSLLSVFPSILLTIFLSKYFEKGIFEGGIK